VPVVVDAAQSNIGDAKSGERPAALAPKPPRPGVQRQSLNQGNLSTRPTRWPDRRRQEQECRFKLELFVISLSRQDDLKVPREGGQVDGKLADASAVKTALELWRDGLASATMWSRRAQEYEAKSNSGDLNAIAEWARSYRSDTQPEQSYSERQLYEGRARSIDTRNRRRAKLTERNR